MNNKYVKRGLAIIMLIMMLGPILMTTHISFQNYTDTQETVEATEESAVVEETE